MNEIETQSDKFLASKSEKRLHRWGFKDSGFELDGEKSVTFSGNRYEVSGTSMPDFIPYIENVLGIEFNKRQQLNDDYQNLYEERPLRIATLPYDLVGLLDYLINNEYTTSTLYETLQDTNIRFAGVDGNFYFSNNRIERDLQVLQIKEGQAYVISK